MIGSIVVRRGGAGLRRPGGKGASIREVRLVGLSDAADGLGAGHPVGWWGRSYEVEAAEGHREGGSVRYLHLRPAGRCPVEAGA